jgi:hypothetical protein
MHDIGRMKLNSFYKLCKDINLLNNEFTTGHLMLLFYLSSRLDKNAHIDVSGKFVEKQIAWVKELLG